MANHPNRRQRDKIAIYTRDDSGLLTRTTSPLSEAEYLAVEYKGYMPGTGVTGELVGWPETTVRWYSGHLGIARIDGSTPVVYIGQVAYICPRGFANEIAYWRVKASDVPEVQALLDTYIDKANSHAGWISNPTAREQRRAIAWEDRQYSRQAGSAWGL